jgi:hypothetical protein
VNAALPNAHAAAKLARGYVAAICGGSARCISSRYYKFIMIDPISRLSPALSRDSLNAAYRDFPRKGRFNNAQVVARRVL